MNAHSALRALRRDPIYVWSSILTLAVGLAAAIVAALYIADELSFDRFVPNHQQIAVVVTKLNAPGQARISMDDSPGMLAALLKADVPGIADASRLAYDDLSVRHGDIEAREASAWVDPNFFDLLRLPQFEGDARLAMRFPDGAVLTESLARKYFGASRALGSSIQIDGTQVFQVRAVIKDPPANSHLAQLGIFLSGRSAASPLTKGQPGFYNAVVDLKPATKVRFVRERTYLRLAPGFDLESLDRAMERWSLAHVQQLKLPPDAKARFVPVPLDRLHTYPFKGASLGASDLHADLGSLADFGVLGALILLLAVTNFVNLGTARSANRAREVGVRKAAGASQTDLVRMFLGETLVQVVIATVLATSLVEMSLPFLNAFLMKDMTFDYCRDPAVAASLLATILVVTPLSGAYPAFVLSSFGPAASLRSSGTSTGGSSVVRNGLVAFQFSVLMVLLLGAAVVWLQARFATNEGLRLDKDGVLLVHTTPCRGGFAEEVRRLPGVRSAGCASQAMLGVEDFNPLVTDAALKITGHPTATVALGLADFDVFQTLGIAPLAGRSFLTSHRTADELPAERPGHRHGSTVLNESAVRLLGFAHPAEIVGRTVLAPVSGGGADAWQVIGVVPDFTLDLRSAAVKPTAYIIDPGYPFEQALTIRLDRLRIPETLGAIDRTWKATGHLGAPRRQFLDDYVQRLYVVTTRQGALVSALCLVATVLACAGLLALSSYTAQRRTKEIGIRKAMGASARDIVQILLLQFARPIGIGILIGTPIAYLAARHWLDGFTYHVELQPWLFAAAASVALTIGLGAGAFHALAVARARPVDALRYE